MLALVTALAVAAATAPAPGDAARGFMADLGRGDFAAAHARLAPEVAPRLPLAALGGTWAELVAGTGAVREIRFGAPEPYKGLFFVDVACEGARARVDGKVVVNADGRVRSLYFEEPAPLDVGPVPPYVDRADFTERALTIGRGDWRLPATLTMPVKPGPHPLVVLVHGSGPADRDETIGPNKTFRDLAWGLASLDVAVLRYEKRTRWHRLKLRLGQVPVTPHEETVEDAVWAVKDGMAQPGVDRGHVFVLGHSLGGGMLPRIAQGAPDLAGLIALAGTTESMAQAVLRQARYMKTLPGQSAAGLAELTTLEKQALRAMAPDLSLSTPPAELPFGTHPAYLLYQRRYDAPIEARSLPQRMLFLQGERDYQVTTADLDRWRAALDDRPDVAFKVYPALNHIFTAGTGPANSGEYTRQAFVDAQVLMDIGLFVRQ